MQQPSRSCPTTPLNPAPLPPPGQAPSPASRLQQQGLPMLGDFPCVDIPPNADDCRFVGAGRIWEGGGVQVWV